MKGAVIVYLLIVAVRCLNSLHGDSNCKILG